MSDIRPIDANALKEAFNSWKNMDDYYHNTDCVDIPFTEVFDLIDNAPTVEYPFYAEAYQTGYEEGKNGRPQGEWINHRNDNGHNIADCSICGKTMQWHDEDDDGIPRYCWYCGADMRGDKK